MPAAPSAEPAPTHPSSAPPPGVSEQSAASAEADAPEVTLVDPGKPPLELLRYGLVPGAVHEFRVAHRLTLFEGDQPRGAVEVQAPLSVTTEAAAADAFALTLRLGPVHITREGGADAFDPSGGAPAGELGARLLARVRLTRAGVVQEARIEQQASREALLLYETLLSLDVPPGQAVGAGARWVAEQNHPGSARTQTEYELVRVVPERATFRVQRQQLDGKASEALQASGEWTFTRDAWPPTGHDQVAETLAEARPGARLSVRFTVTSSAEAAPPPNGQTR